MEKLTGKDRFLPLSDDVDEHKAVMIAVLPHDPNAHIHTRTQALGAMLETDSRDAMMWARLCVRDFRQNSFPLN
jgi:hypothetical protein